jgi:glycosyltransferase involved in cell wall biosynthesis
VGHKRQNYAKTTVAQVVHLVPTDMNLQSTMNGGGMLRMPPEMAEVMRRLTVILFFIERDRFSGIEAANLRQAGQVWVANRDAADAVEGAGVEPHRVKVIPIPYGSDYPSLKNQRASVWIRTGHQFYTFLHIGKWEPRKSQHELFRAFLTEFRHGENVRFIVKTSKFGRWENYPSSASDSLRLLLEDPIIKANGWTGENLADQVRVHTGKLSVDQIQDMHRMSDCYVQASHCEGWDYPAFDAYLSGEHIIHVPFGGTRQFLPDDDLTNSRIWHRDFDGFESVHPGYGWPGGAQWAKVDPVAIRQAMRHAVERRLSGDHGVRIPTRVQRGIQMRLALVDLLRDAGSGHLGAWQDSLPPMPGETL